MKEFDYKPRLPFEAEVSILRAMNNCNAVNAVLEKNYSSVPFESRQKILEIIKGCITPDNIAVFRNKMTYEGKQTSLSDEFIKSLIGVNMMFPEKKQLQHECPSEKWVPIIPKELPLVEKIRKVFNNNTLRNLASIGAAGSIALAAVGFEQLSQKIFPQRMNTSALMGETVKYQKPPEIEATQPIPAKLAEIQKTPTMNEKLFTYLKNHPSFDTDPQREAYIGEVIKIAARLDPDNKNPELARHLMAVTSLESGFYNTAVNPLSNAVGQIQILPDIAIMLGTTPEELLSMTPIQQLHYTEKYLTPYKGKLTSLEKLCAAIFAPAAIDQDTDYIIYKNGSDGYAQNRYLDIKNKGYLTLGDFKNAAIESARKHGDTSF